MAGELIREFAIDKLSDRAREYFTGDVQRAWIEREGREYRVEQLGHWSGYRVAARVYATSLREAVKRFNAMAREDDRNHA